MTNTPNPTLQTPQKFVLERIGYSYDCEQQSQGGGVRKFRCFLPLLALLVCVSVSQAAPPDATRPVEGLRDRLPAVHAFVGGRIVVSPDEVIERGNLVVRDGVIEAVGAEVKIPADARRWDVAGKTLYPGFVDAYSESAFKSHAPVTAGHWNDLITPEFRCADYLPSQQEELQKKLRAQGIVARLIAPDKGIVKGSSCLVTTGDQPAAHVVVKAQVAQHVRLTISRRPRRETYPNSPMGAFALARQTFHDAQWYAAAQRARRAQPDLPRPETNLSLDALLPYLTGDRLVLINTSNERALLTAESFAKEFSLQAAFVGSGREYRRLEAVQGTSRTVIVPLNFPKAPRVDTPETAMQATLESLLHWELAPENPARLAEARVPIAFTSQGLADANEFLKQLRVAVKRGLSSSAALEALTATPARLFGVETRLGGLKAGLDAHLIVADGDIFEDQTKILETWISGRRYEVTREPALDARGKWEMKFDGLPRGTALIGGESGKLAGEFRLELATDAKPQKQGKQKKTKRSTQVVKLDALAMEGSQLTCRFEGDAIDRPGIVRFSVVAEEDEKAGALWLGTVVWPDGKRQSVSARRVAKFDLESDEFRSLQADKEQQESTANKRAKDEPAVDEARLEVNYPLGAFGRSAAPEAPEYVLFKGATIWTCGKPGVIPQGDVLLERGKISAVGQQIKAPATALVIDATGKHVTPGIIDCHSHIATDGGVNESAQAITAEVRIADFIDADDIAIYRQLAGGVTTANILHGSANPIGGQNQVIKFRWGGLPEELKFSEAPPGIKFALGENVKQSNWGESHTTRYPQTRMGVEQLIRDALTAAQEYERRWKQWNKDHAGLPPRRDLKLEALAEVIRGERWVHCHSYRQDEILSLLRTLADFNITIGTLQHILEGYKVADEMAKHKAMGSSFSDWWAYKFEVFDAIPYNGALMHEQGVVVSFNSDDAELGRRLNLEAAKAIKYGGVSPEEALKFVTLNPAKQLRIDRYVGSLEKGKQADLVVWSGDPLSNFSRCEQTWIDGKRYFDLAEDQTAREAAESQRVALIQKILSSGAEMAGVDESAANEDDLWPRHDTFCHGHGHEHGGHGGEGAE